jgi:hypothetical protein
VDFLEDLGVVGRRDIHEREEHGGRIERPVQEPEVPGVHDDLEQGFAGGLQEFVLAQVDGDDLRALELADDPLPSTPDVQDEALGLKIGYGDLELGVHDRLLGFGTLLRGQGKRRLGVRPCGRRLPDVIRSMSFAYRMNVSVPCSSTCRCRCSTASRSSRNSSPTRFPSSYS